MIDVLVIGSGAGGAPLAHELSRAGMQVLVLEKGPWYKRPDFHHDEVRMSGHSGFFVPPIEREPHILVDHAAPAAAPTPTRLGWIACCVGGGTAHMGASLYRFHPQDFTMGTLAGGSGPAGTNLVNWPYTYRDLEEYYCRAEWEIGVSGQAGCNPFEGPRSAPYPMGPVDSHPIGNHIDNAAKKLGLHTFPTPLGINSELRDDRPKCSHCDFCAGYGCPTGARGSMGETLLLKAERTGRCSVRVGVMVTRITLAPDGRANGCEYLDENGSEQRVHARLVCVSCSAVESARLLLNSATHTHPEGLSNTSGLVGRHLQFHTISTGFAQFRYDRHLDKGLRERSHFIGRSVMDHYFLPPGISQLPKGGLLRFDLSAVHPIAQAKRIARDAGVWGNALKLQLKQHFCEYREVEFEAYQDFLPNEQTFVELDPSVQDYRGIPVARIHLGEPEHHRTAGKWLVERGHEILHFAGADQLTTGRIGATTGVMAHGTCRFGNNPRTSVLNAYCQSHDVPNLFVVDGSFMPTSGAAPSTLTIIANSFRTAAYIIDRSRTGEI